MSNTPRWIRLGLLGSSTGAVTGGAGMAPPGPKPAEDWFTRLFARDQRKVYRGKELLTIGMPCGGIAAGQLYVRGDGTLAQWWIWNNSTNTGYGDKCYRTYRPPSPIQQGFAIRVQAEGEKAAIRQLSEADFDAIEFIGEYPIAEIRYKTADKPALPVEVTGHVFSPFIPLNARDSALPCTILQYTVRNASNRPLDIGIAGWLQNPVCLDYAGTAGLVSRNAIVRDATRTTVRMDVAESNRNPEQRRVTVFEDFEDGTYNKWTKTGEAFGDAPATGTLPGQQNVSGWQGKFLVNSFNGGDKPIGRLTSRPFKISEPYIGFLIGGGSHPGRTCLNLLIDGKVVRSAVGKDNEALQPAHWNVQEFIGREARLEILDEASEGWGHINVDHIHFTNLPPGKDPAALKTDPGYGDISLTVLDPNATGFPAVLNVIDFFGPWGDDPGIRPQSEVATSPLGRETNGALATSARLALGESRTFTFILSWFFPNRPRVGQMYSNWFSDSVAVADYVAQNLGRLKEDTFAFRDCYLDTTLPYWFMARLMMPVSTLATETVQWWKNGRFYAWEGVGCCHGTCTHVWNYDHAGARLFPELERSTRLMQDLGVAFDENTGLVGFRGAREYAADGQVGTVLKTYREHLMSKDNGFLDVAWPRVKKALEHAISHDGNEDGLIEDSQHNTFDINFVGANTFVGSLYLAALRAGAAMAQIMGDREAAIRYTTIADRGWAFTMQRLFNGEYFIHDVPQGHDGTHQYTTGCLADQVFGQGWAHQLGLGYIYPRHAVLSALGAVFKYCWTSDVGPYNKVYPPQRWFAREGDAGLFTCTWPRGGRPREPVLYRDEVWTGIEYQVANHMLYEGMVREAFAIVRGIHERYDGSKHNPWNEVECGDHYARAMASWGCVLGASGFVYDGPRGLFGFAPRLTPEDFRCVYTSAESWGTISQKREAGRQTNRVEVKYGQLRVKELVFEAADEARKNAVARLAGQRVSAQVHQEGRRVQVQLAEPITATRGQTIEIVLE